MGVCIIMCNKIFPPNVNLGFDWVHIILTKAKSIFWAQKNLLGIYASPSTFFRVFMGWLGPRTCLLGISPFSILSVMRLLTLMFWMKCKFYIIVPMEPNLIITKGNVLGANLFCRQFLYICLLWNSFAYFWKGAQCIG